MNRKEQELATEHGKRLFDTWMDITEQLPAISYGTVCECRSRKCPHENELSSVFVIDPADIEAFALIQQYWATLYYTADVWAVQQGRKDLPEEMFVKAGLNPATAVFLVSKRVFPKQTPVLKPAGRSLIVEKTLQAFIKSEVAA